MSVTGLPFDDIRALAAALPAADETARSLAEERSAEIAGRLGPMGLEARIAAWLSAWSGKSPAVNRPMTALFAGTHGCGEASPAEDTLAGVTRLAAGGGAVNQVCAVHDIGLKVFDLALQYPVAHIAVDEAMDEKGSAATIGFGMEAIAGGVDLLGLAGFGRGSEAANAVLIALLLGESVADAIGLAGADPKGPMADCVEAAIERHRSSARDPLELLRRIGGREHSALAGGILAARVDHVPAVLSGASACCIALLLDRLSPGASHHCVIAGGEAGGLAGRIAQETGMVHILPGCTENGEGVSAALAIGMIRAFAAVHSGFVAEA